MYILSPKALKAIEDARPNGIIRDLAATLLCSENTINRYLRENDNVVNGDLTKKAALEVIQKSSGLKQDDILKRVAVSATM